MGVLNLDQAIKALCLLAAGYFLASTLYQWRRLRHIPGPFVASFSYLWLGISDWNGEQYEWHKVLGEKYGPLVRIGPNEVSTDDPETIRRIAGAKSTYPRSGWYDGTRVHADSDSIFTMVDPVLHDKRKAKTSQGYSGRETPGLETAIEEQIENFINLIRRKYVRKPGANSKLVPLELGRVYSLFTLDIISRIALGKEFGGVEADEDVVGFTHNIEAYMPIMNVLGDIPWARNIVFSKLGIRLLSPKPTDKAGIGLMMKMVNDEVRKRYTGDAKTFDMLGSFRRHGLSEIDCQTEALFMFIAGSETTASVMRLTLFYLIGTPAVYQRLKSEIKAAIESGRASSPITAAEARQLPYLQAVLYEGLRIRPTATATFGKKVPPEGDTIHGHFIPGGTTVAMNLASLMRSKAIFGEDADIFRPERFLEIDREAREEMQRQVELIFGYGRWMCAGKVIAWLELNKVLFEIMAPERKDKAIPSPEKPSQAAPSTPNIDGNGKPPLATTPSSSEPTLGAIALPFSPTRQAITSPYSNTPGTTLRSTGLALNPTRRAVTSSYSNTPGTTVRPGGLPLNPPFRATPFLFFNATQQATRPSYNTIFEVAPLSFKHTPRLAALPFGPTPQATPSLHPVHNSTARDAPTNYESPTLYMPENPYIPPASLFPCRNVNGPIARYVHPDGKKVLVYVHGDSELLLSSPEIRAAWAVRHGQDFAGHPDLIIARRLEHSMRDGTPIIHNRPAAEVRAAIAAVRLAHWVSEGFDTLVIATSSSWLLDGATVRSRIWISNGWRMKDPRDSQIKDLWQTLLASIRQWRYLGLSVKFLMVLPTWRS
ncbi:hypothetical protein O1611_g7444 [Lasiodiplodia mahajangana]|uniref:Uncharacterized protein n=1 Tax=Lasiodiplodia mahajangana TaxID=1108764 RepID=A0ACC2JFS4_9PEZI|nr:hypothetical protein O1611_g7444 [Lasiodiplodia mahajangana]